MECTCSVCKSACENKPGWFLPGEAEKVAVYLGITLKKLFQTKLGVDWWEDNPNIYALTPAIKNMSAGEEYPGDPSGVCVFLKKGLCEIHKVKPYECKQLDCRESAEVRKEKRVKEKVKEAWEKNQEQIIDLLGREPEPSPYYSRW